VEGKGIKVTLASSGSRRRDVGQDWGEATVRTSKAGAVKEGLTRGQTDEIGGWWTAKAEEGLNPPKKRAYLAKKKTQVTRDQSWGGKRAKTAFCLKTK